MLKSTMRRVTFTLSPAFAARNPFSDSFLGLTPQERVNRNCKPARAGDSGNANLLIYVFHEPAAENDRSVARFRGLVIVAAFALGFRCAPPQALCCRLLRRLVAF
jgi:hypothetical protein